MVKTGADGFAVFGNLSGENLAVPEGLIAYGVIQGTEKHLVKLVKVGNVIPAQVGIIVRGKPNTEYSLTATTESPMFKRQKQNLLKVSEKQETLKPTKTVSTTISLRVKERKLLSFLQMVRPSCASKELIW